MQIAILTLDGFNELDCFLALDLLNRAGEAGVSAFLAGPSRQVTSMNGVTVDLQGDMRRLAAADGVIIGPSMRARDFAADGDFVDALPLDPGRQLIGAQSSGALLLCKKGFLQGFAVTSDLKTKPWLEALGQTVVERPLLVTGAIATTGGSLSAQYLSAWFLLRAVGRQAALNALADAAPVGESPDYEKKLVAVAQAADPSLGS
ncbi:MAG: DJ-1/PfpI family protein [Pseudomonadota bacterium]